MNPPASVLPPVPPSETQSLADLIEELTNQLQAGEAVNLEACAAKYPQHGGAIRELLPALQVLAEMSGSAAPGPVPAGSPPGSERQTLGDFRILREVGRGGMGVVYEAEQISLGRRVALKVLPLAATMDPRQLQRFHNEARAAAGLHHTNIVPVYFVGCERGVHFYAMQFIDGQSLAALLEQQRTGLPSSDEPMNARTPAPAKAKPPAGETAVDPAARTAPARRDAAYFRRVAEWGIQAAEALDHAHQLGIVHRDIKPANLLIDAVGRLWITDFGLAQIQSDPRLTMTGDLVGTLRYMSPEQALAKRVVVDHRTDIYSLGATLYELLTLEPAFNGRDREELLRQIAFDEPTRPRRLNRAIPQELETVVLKAMEGNASDRYATAQELADDLRNILDDRPIRAQRPSLLNRLGRWRRRHKSLVWSAAALGFMLLLLGGASLGRQQWQMAALERAVEDDLQEADALQQEERWPEELRVLERASGRLAAGGPQPLRQRVEVRNLYVATVARLDDARLQGDALDLAGADLAYAAAFAGFGLDLDTLSPAEAAERIQTSAIRSHLIAALADWANVRKRLLKQGDAHWQETLVAIRTAAGDSWPDDLRDLLARGHHQSIESLAESQGALELPPSSLVALGRALRAKGATRQAVALLRKAQRSHAQHFWINVELAHSLKDSEQGNEAVRFYTVALALRPQSDYVRYSLGVALGQRGDWQEALDAHREAIRLRPNDAAAYWRLGQTLLRKGDWKEAAEAIRKAIDRRPEFPSYYSDLSVALHRMNARDEALAALKTAIQLDPKFAFPYRNLGVVLHSKGDSVGAIAALKTAIRLRPDFADAHYNLGVVLQEKGVLGDAIQAYEDTIRIKPDYAEAHCNLGRAFHDQRKLPQAVEAYQRAIKFQPKLANAHYMLGITFYDMGKPADAEAAFRTATKLRPKFAPAYHDLGIVLAAQNKLREAVDAYRSAVALKPDYALAYSHLGWALKLLKDLPRAEDACRKAIQIKPDYAGAHQYLAMVLYDRQLYTDAVRSFATAFTAQPKLADDLNSHSRYNAACAAALAGCGQGVDADKIDPKERARLRWQALDWLRADLGAWNAQLSMQPGKVRPLLSTTMRHWQADTDFAGVRGGALANLPAAERQPWQELWRDVADTLARAQGTPAPQNKAAGK